MPFLSKMLSFWNNLFRRRQVERDLNDELQAWLEEMVERKIQAGFAPETAREAAMLELGGIDRIKDLVREQRIGFSNLRRAGMTAVVAIAAFVSGASAVSFLRWTVPAPTAPSVAVPRSPSPVLEGQLVDNATGQPIPFVEIGIREHPTRRYTYTDETRHFEFRNPPMNAYGLEAGPEYWSVSQGAHISFGTSPPSVTFGFLGTDNVSVKNKNGEPAEGESNEMSFAPNGPHSPPTGKILRRFRYDSSVIELRANNLSPGKLAWR